MNPANLATAREMLAVNGDGTYSLEYGDWAQSWTREAVVREFGPVKAVVLAKTEVAR